MGESSTGAPSTRADQVTQLDPMKGTNIPTFYGIHHIALTVSDLAVSVPFYETLWGSQPVATLTGESVVRRIFRPAPGLTIGLTQHQTPLAEPFDPTRPGLDHVGSACADREAVVEWANHLDAVGIAHSDIVDTDYGTALSVKDPDNIALEFYVSAGPEGV